MENIPKPKLINRIENNIKYNDKELLNQPNNQLSVKL